MKRFFVLLEPVDKSADDFSDLNGFSLMRCLLYVRQKGREGGELVSVQCQANRYSHQDDEEGRGWRIDVFSV